MRKLVVILTVLGLALSGWSLHVYNALYPANTRLPEHFSPVLVLSGMALIFAGHMIRAANWQLMFKPSDGIRWGVSFAGICLGGLYNTVLPFRLGGLIRAFVVRRLSAVSFAYILTAVVIERALDSLILGTLGLGIGAIFGLQNKLSVTLYGALIAVSLVSLGTVLTMRNLPLWLRLAVQRCTALFREDLKSRLRFSMWSLSYGLHSRVPLRRFALVGALSLVTWAVYLSGAALLIYGSAPQLLSPETAALAAPNAFAASVLPSGPAYLGTYQLAFVKLSAAVFDPALLRPLSFVAWFAVTVPLAAAGLLLLVFSRARLQRRTALPSPDDARLQARKDKLSRSADVSREFAPFLETFFSGRSIWDLVHRAEFKGAFTSLSAFRGGSNAVSLLVYRDSRTQVAKVTSSAHAGKLKSQRDWLLERRELSEVPNVLGDEERDGIYSLYLEHLDSFESFFQFIHSADSATSWHLLQSVVQFVREEIHSRPVIAAAPETCIDEYIGTKISDKLRRAAALQPDIARLLDYDTLIVNGREVRSIGCVVALLSDRTPQRSSLLSYRPCQVHGDLTVENILVDRETLAFRLLDPNDENTVSAAALDFAKLYQSLHSGYEFLCALDRVAVRGNEIRFDELKSNAYTLLYGRLHEYLAETMPPAELSSIFFHEAVHYIRLLTYRVEINPKTACVFLGVAARLFDEFLEFDFSQSRSTGEPKQLQNLSF